MASLAHGFAGQNGGTTGGSGGRSVTVSTGDQLQAAINGSGSGPLTIYVSGPITPGNTAGSEISLSGRHDISIIGKGTSGELKGIGIHVSDGSSNLILQNLRIHDVTEGTRDAIGIEENSHNIWIDHNELSSSMSVGKDYYDGLLDIKRGSHNITVSNNYVHDHHKTSLVGYSDSDTSAWHVTYDHNVFETLGSRVPSIRGGDAHIYNNYFHDIDVSAVNLRMGAQARVENNVFEDVKNPVVSLDSEKIGTWDLRGNTLSNVSWSSPDSGEAVAGPAMKSTTSWSAPYGYSLAATSAVKSLALSVAGIGKIGTPAGTGGSETVPGGSDTGAGGSDTGPAGTPDDDAGLLGTGGDDTLNGGSAADSISGGGGRDVLNGGGGNDTVLGGTNDDVLQGGEGNDQLDGGNGRDTLNGGAGKDRLAGGDGDDVFAFAAPGDSPDGSGRDVVTDFEDGDRLDLSKLDARSTSSGDQAFTFIGSDAFGERAGELRASQHSGYVLVEGDVNGNGDGDFAIELSGSQVPGSSDFIL